MVTRLNVFVIEDHPIVRESLVRLLTREGHEVTGVDSAESLPADASRAAAPLFVVDGNLPGEDGFCLVRRLRAESPNAGIIMATARTAVADRVSGYTSGADVYLTKPLDPEEVVAAVRALSRYIRGSR